MSRFQQWRAAINRRPHNRTIALAAGLAMAATLVVTGTGANHAARELSVALPTQPAPAATTGPASPTWESVSIRAGDTLAGILTLRGQTPATIHAVMTAGPAAKTLTAIRAGNTLQLATGSAGEIDEISYAPDPYRAINIRRNGQGGFDSEVIEKSTLTVTRFAAGTIESSLFDAGKQAGVSDTVILEMADVFGYDIDFALEVQQGDSFRVMYEEILVDGEKVRDGDVLAAEFTNEGKTYRAIRFKTADGRGGYYTPDGIAMRKAFLRSPVDFARISSRFTTRRFHPILHTFRAHKGVDYAAARGTPVKATANGRIEYAGNKGAYGRAVIIRHGSQQSTLYGHLNGFAKNVRAGARVEQGQVIGYVGSTGLASGPHLHYEFRVNGVHMNPLKMKSIPAAPIAGTDKAAFLAEAGRLVAMLDNFAGRTAVAGADTRTKNSVTADL